MTLAGHVKNGVIVLDEPMALPEGLAVEVVMRNAAATGTQEPSSLYESLKDFVGCIDAPEDWATNHDKYLRQEHLGE